MRIEGLNLYLVAAVLAIGGCDSGGGADGTASASGSGGIETLGQSGGSTSVETESDTTPPDESDTNGDTGSTTSGVGSTTQTSDSKGDASGSSGSMSTTGSSTDGDDGSSTGETQNCEQGGSKVVEFSYIWIANSSEGTISKIDTQTGVELGRYITRPDGSGNPSRTSVNRFGDVVVANRAGGITKVYADAEDCLESNGLPGIQTSSGPDDVLAWGEDECIAWYTQIDHDNNRPVAWTNGTLNEETCEYEGVDVYTAYLDTGVAGSLEIARLDGTTGVISDTIAMPDTPLKTHGFYGAAIDGQDRAWFSQLQGGQLVRVNNDMTVDTWDVEGVHNGYGITVTNDGYVWICGRDTHRFDPVTETWAQSQAVEPNAYVHTGGCMGDGNGVLYRGAHENVLGIDTETLDIVVTLPAGQPGDDHIWGVAVDFDGFVWAIPRNAEHAYKMDPAVPADPIVQTVEGLQNCYTYSDMTGFSLNAVVPG